MSEQKPREFWVIPCGEKAFADTGLCIEGKPANNGIAYLCVHTIEHSAFAAVSAERDALKEILNNCREKRDNLATTLIDVQKEHQALKLKCEELEDLIAQLNRASDAQSRQWNKLLITNSKLNEKNQALQAKVAELEKENELDHLTMENAFNKMIVLNNEITAFRSGAKFAVKFDDHNLCETISTKQELEIQSFTAQLEVLKGALEMMANCQPRDDAGAIEKAVNEAYAKLAREALSKVKR